MNSSVSLLSPSTLAFVGDAVFGLMVRTKLSEVNRPLSELHRRSVQFVSATAQARAFTLLEPELSEEELAVFKRGRNSHTSNTPKNATIGEYHAATGLEALFGYLYLSKNLERAETLFYKIWENFSGTIE